MRSNKEIFLEDGIIVLKNCISSKDVAFLRQKFESEHQAIHDKTYIGFDEIDFTEEIVERFLSPNLTDALKDIFKEPYILPDFILQYGNTPKSVIRPHYDLQSYIRQGLDDILYNDVKYAKVGLYLQDSDEQNPGSIWYVPKSHKFKVFRLVWKIPSVKLKNILDIFLKNIFKKRQVPVNASAGDIVIFDGRLLHSSAPMPITKSSKKPKKIAFYISVTGNLKSAEYYMTNETLKFALEIGSKNPNDCQRIGYFFGKLSEIFSERCNKLGVRHFELSSKFLNKIKNS